MDAAGLFNHFSCANVMAKTGCAKFEFHKIVSKPAPAPRFNNSTTNISELIGFIMKSNGSRWATLPQFLKQCIRLYNSQIKQMTHNYYRCKKYKLTSIGFSIVFSATEEFHQTYSHSFKLIEDQMKHDFDSNYTLVRGVFAMDSQSAENHFAVLSWQHKIPTDGTLTPFLHPFTFSCEIHLHLCENLICSCVCINLLLEHLRKTKFESFEHLPSHVQTEIKDNNNFCLNLFYLVFNTQNRIQILEN